MKRSVRAALLVFSPVDATILWPFGLLSGSEDDFGVWPVSWSHSTKLFISGIVSACYPLSLGGELAKYNRIFENNAL
jgi:hypothetical protein